MEMLEPLKEATLATNKDKYPTLSKMMPYYDELLDHFEKMEQTQPMGNNVMPADFYGMRSTMMSRMPQTLHCIRQAPQVF